MPTFKQIFNGDVPSDQQPFSVRDSSGSLSWYNNNMSVKLLDYEGAWYSTTNKDDRSGALKLKVAPFWEVRLKVESDNAGFFNGNIFQDNFWERHERIYEASGGDDFEVVLYSNESIEFDVDRKSGNGIEDFKLVFSDKTFSHDGTFAPNDPFYITLVSAIYNDPNPPTPEPTPTDPNPEPAPPVDIIKSGLEKVYDVGVDSVNSPFSVFNITGNYEWKNSGMTLRLADYDPQRFSQVSGSVLLEVKQGHYVDLDIMNENSGWFNAISQSLKLNPRLISEDFGGGNSDFTIRLYGGSILFADSDGNSEDLGSAFGGYFYLSDGVGSYAIGEPANDEYEITLENWGLGEDPHNQPIDQCPEGFTYDPVRGECVANQFTPEPDQECPEGYVYDEETGTCVLIPPSPNPPPQGDTDPFDLVDDFPTPFEPDDELSDRLVKSFTFGVNGAFRAIEAVIEGIMIALPAVIVIGSAVVMSRVMMKATEKGAAKVADSAKKAGDFLRSGNKMNIEGVGLE
jgi:hypothetical protein